MHRIPNESPKILNIYLLIAQYPMLARRIREEMRAELFHRGIITTSHFEQEVQEKAVLSQQREGLSNPLWEETAEQWEQRLGLIRDHLTDFYFAYNLPLELVHRIINNLLINVQHAVGLSSDINLTFNPELAPLEMVLKQAEKYEALPAEQSAAINHHLQELVVVLLKSLISDQLAFIRIAKRWFTTTDFRTILTNRIGTGKIGGKAAGLLLAYKILQNTAPEIFERITIPRSYFVAADVFYDFLALNGVELLDQKYKSADQIRAEYPSIQDRYTQGRFPEEIADQLRDILTDVGKTPLIVRSSSLLEDNFGTSFAGKYASFFCPNQGTVKENLRDLTLAIRRIYASVYSPDALMYRRRMGLIDYDERMAILLQEVQGERHRDYYFPTLAGVAYSLSPIVWNPRLRREEGFVRLVMGLGTRAVERVANDYPRLINLSHPQLRPEVTRKAIRYYSQHFVDVLNLKQNSLATLPLEEVLGPDFQALRWIASVDDGDTIRPPLSIGSHLQPDQMVLTFDGLLQRSDFVRLVKEVLKRVAEQYQLPVDLEFAVSLAPTPTGRPALNFHLLQCRPQNLGHKTGGVEKIKLANIPTGDWLFLSTQMAPQGLVEQVEYVVYVDPLLYRQLESSRDYTDVARLVGHLNKTLEGKVFVLIGPGRWGSSDYQQGVPVTYADIFNTRALVEVAVKQGGYTSEPSYGTHFFQDLVETQIYPLGVYPEDPGSAAAHDVSSAPGKLPVRDILNWDFLNQSADQMSHLLDLKPSNASRCMKVIHVPTERPGWHLKIAMDGEYGLGYFSEGRP